MTDSLTDRAQLVAAALIDYAERHAKTGGLQQPISDLSGLIYQDFSIELPAQVIEDAISVLERYDIGERITAGGARPYLFIGSQNFSSNSTGGWKGATLGAMLKEKKTPLSVYRKLGSRWLLEALREEFRAEIEARELRTQRFLDLLAGRAVAGPAKSIPASDRTVTVDHNADPAKTIDEALEAVEKKLREGNETGVILADDRTVAVSEVGLLRQWLRASHIHAMRFRETAVGILGWIAEKTSGAAIAELAKVALKHILDWLA